MLEILCDTAECSPTIRLAQVFICGLLAILFLQSGLDKVLDWKGNIGWLTEHFSQTPFRNMVPPLVGMLTLFELATGLVAGVGAVALLVLGIETIAIVGLILAALTFLQLFAGQRIAKDYAGAVQIAPYFLIAMFGLFLFQ